MKFFCIFFGLLASTHALVTEDGPLVVSTFRCLELSPVPLVRLVTVRIVKEAVQLLLNTALLTELLPMLMVEAVSLPQFDFGAAPMSGFSVGCDGTIAYNGGATFWECQTVDNGEANIYLTPGGTNCGAVKLIADTCFSGCARKPCPANLNRPYEYPHLIVPIDSSKPSLAPGTSYFGEVSSTITSILNFDIPTSDAGKTCTLMFLFPFQSQLKTSSYTFSGNSRIDFSELSGIATTLTSYENCPRVGVDYGTTVLAPGKFYTIATFLCPTGETVSFGMRAVGNTYLKYFEDYNTSPTGLYITTS